LTWAVILGALLASAAINRFRGMGVSGSRLYASGLFGLLTGLVLWDWRAGIAAALCFLFWGAFSWGRWFDLGRLPDDWNREEGEMSSFDKVIEAVSFDNDHLALLARHAFGILPAALLLGWWCGWEWLAVIPAFAALVVGCYEIAWQVTKSKTIEVAEVLTGLVWGGLLLAVLFWCWGSVYEPVV
jgi:hypothetical protein